MKKYNIIVLLSLMIISTACEHWLDLQPEGQATYDQLYSSGDGYRSVINGLYREMGKEYLYGRELQFGILDCMSQQYNLEDDKISKNLACRRAEQFKYDDNELNPVIDKIWASAYTIIANANEMLQNIEKASPDIFEYGEMERKVIMGEAYACRALLHFDLLRLFAPAPINDDGGSYVPYVDIYPNITATSIAVKPYLEKVINDLTKARELTMVFDTTTVGITVNKNAKNRFSKVISEVDYSQFFRARGCRLSYYSITALLARVHQYAGNYTEALDYANQVIDFKTENINFYIDDFKGIMQSEGADQNAFEKRSDLKVLGNLIFAVHNANSYLENQLDLYFRNPSEEQSSAALTYNWLPVRYDYLFNNRDIAEATTDIRSTYLLYNAKGATISGKWFLNSDEAKRDQNVNYLPVIRFTETRYIAAESYARQGNFDQAYRILNEIRTNRGVQTALKQQTSWDEFQTDLIADARREWIAEGQLFYLYKRLNASLRINATKEERPLNRSEFMFPRPINQKN